ncbi:YcnI family protein [Streptomyces spiramenti]|uniref:YcnI family protein n=1 Tax=Streptomyces spiramenti TaxID=2720606 RepID=A0ABX1AY59_9ACTN|nr:YcnI family protein [Streptomyces spiramenti]NJP69275.1 YcnI family protein [Streptomyces spiramenti]
MTTPLVRRARTALGCAVAAGAVLAMAAPASAHVTIDPKEVPGGGYATINVKVPNERDDASTVAVELHLDPDHPLASVQPQAVPGWEVEVETAELDEPLEVHGSQVTEAPSKIIWTGGEISPGTFQQFPLSVGRLPEDVDQLVLKAIQTYDSDEVVRWIDDPTDGAEHPAATLTLSAAAADGHGHGDDTEAEGAAAPDAGQDGDATASGATVDASASDTTARVIGGVGLAVGVAGVVVAFLALRRPGAGS